MEEGKKTAHQFDLLLQQWPKDEDDDDHDSDDVSQSAVDGASYNTLQKMVKDQGFPDGVDMVPAINKDGLMKWVRKAYVKKWEQSDEMSLGRKHGTVSRDTVMFLSLSQPTNLFDRSNARLHRSQCSYRLSSTPTRATCSNLTEEN